LNKTPRGVHQTNILQHVFKYSDARECFDSFRLVCKSWQNSVETIRLDTCPPLTIFQELCCHERNGHFPPFYSKYLQTFRKLGLCLQTTPNFDMTKWDSISNFLLDNMTNLREIGINMGNSIPPEFVIFLYNLFENSESTLEKLAIIYKDNMVTLPTILLPSMRLFTLYVCRNDKNKVKTFNYLMKTLVGLMCPHLEVVAIEHINRAPQILKYITKNYPSHFYCSPEISILEHIPLKLSYLNLEKIAAYRYASHIEYLYLHVKNLQIPSEGGWDNYKEILSFFSNLKGILFYYKHKCITLVEYLRSIHSASQTIWQQRIEYFKSQNIKILSEKDHYNIKQELRQPLWKSWIFEFRHI